MGNVLHAILEKMIDMSIFHHAFISIFIALGVVITRYITILMPFLSYFYKVYIKRENAGSWNSGLEKEGANIRDLFCTTPKVL